MSDQEQNGGADKPSATPPAWLPFAIDFGPLLVFFLAYRFTRGDGPIGVTIGVVYGTGAFMAAILIAVFMSQWLLKKISPMLWLSAILVLGFGALTIYFHDASFIQKKPTIIYASLATLLLVGWWRGRPLLKYLLQDAYDGLSDAGWMLLSRNWGMFFAALAALNEIMRATLSFDAWLTAKVWGVTALSFAFVVSQMPLMLRHGLDVPSLEKTDD